MATYNTRHCTRFKLIDVYRAIALKMFLFHGQIPERYLLKLYVYLRIEHLSTHYTSLTIAFFCELLLVLVLKAKFDQDNDTITLDIKPRNSKISKFINA